MTNQTRVTRDMALVLCGMFARSDMGLDLPTREEISWAKTAGLKSPRADDLERLDSMPSSASLIVKAQCLAAL